MALPPTETCQECGKTISGRALAHVWQGERVVCTACLRKLKRLDRQREYAEGVASRAHLPPTERQLEFAEDCGVTIPPDVTRGQLSELIDQALARHERNGTWPGRDEDDDDDS